MFLSKWGDRVRDTVRAARRRPSGDPTGDELSRVLHRCPVCGGDFAAHEYAEVSDIALGETAQDKARLQSFLRALRERRWTDAIQMQSWHPQKDNLETYAVRCPRGAALVSLVGHADLMAGDRLIEASPLDSEEAATLNSVLSENRWKPLPP